MKKLTAIFTCMLMLAALVVTGIVGLSGKADGSEGVQVGVSGAGAVSLSDKTSLQTEQSAQPSTSSGFSIVGMWRKVGAWNNACQIFYADGSVFAIGLREDFDYNVIDVTIGKYRLTGSTLEVYDVTGFTLFTSSVSPSLFRQTAQNYVKIFNIVRTGSRGEVEELKDKKNDLYSTFNLDPDYWPKWKDRDDELNIINADCFETRWPGDATWILERVQEY